MTRRRIPEQELKVVNVRLVKEPSLYSETPIRDTDDVVQVMARELAQFDREAFCVLNMNTNGTVINMSVVSLGTLDSAIVSPREVYKSSILSNAASIIVLHNHPSGNISPSREDRLVTKKLIRAGNDLDIPVVDHIIVGGASGELYSFKEQGDLETLKRAVESRDMER